MAVTKTILHFMGNISEHSFSSSPCSFSHSFPLVFQKGVINVYLSIHSWLVDHPMIDQAFGCSSNFFECRLPPIQLQFLTLVTRKGLHMHMRLDPSTYKCIFGNRPVRFWGVYLCSTIMPKCCVNPWLVQQKPFYSHNVFKLVGKGSTL